MSKVFRTFISMKQMITDISEVVKSLTEELEKQRKVNDALREEIRNLNETIDKLNVVICRRNGWIAELEKRLGKNEKPGKNSRNSSVPPSKENMKDEILRRTNPLRKKSDRKPGGQVGHKGQTLAKAGSPDEVTNEIPSYCNTCGNKFDDSAAVPDHFTQVISLPEIRPIVREIRHFVATCKKCGKQTWS